VPIIRVNPRRGAAGYAPLAGGTAAALARCDSSLRGHSLTAPAAVADAIAGAQL